MEQFAKKVFEKNIKKTIQKIEDKSKGCDQIVKIITTKDNKKYVVKIPNHPKYNYREKIACEKLKKLKIIPKIIYFNKKYIIQEYVEGKDIDEIKIPLTKIKKVYLDIGQILKQIHTVKINGFGKITEKGVSKYKNFEKWMYFEFIYKNLKYIEEEKILSKIQIEKLNKYLKENKPSLKSKDSVLLRFDYEESNIKIKNNKITGIIDFGDLSAGPKEFDLVRPYINYYGSKKYDYFIEGYGEINKKRLEYFVVLSLFWMIPYARSRNKKRYERHVKMLKEIILNKDEIKTK
jgi:aminoglycoside phosphotransferase (APT) family kinase protein